MTSVFRLLKVLWRGEQPRLDDLRARGGVIDVSEVTEGDRIVEVALGFGPEFWKAGQHYIVDPGRALVEDGQLILDRGKPLTDRRRLPLAGKTVERIRYKT